MNPITNESTMMQWAYDKILSIVPTKGRTVCVAAVKKGARSSPTLNQPK